MGNVIVRPKVETISLLLLFLLASCAPATQASLETLNLYATPAARAWLPEAYDCAAKNSIAPVMSDPASANIVLQIGEPKNLTTPAYQIDVEEILIVTHRESLIQNLTLEEARALFAGRGDPSMQVWVYPSEEDMQIVFESLVMSGESVSAFAKTVSDPQRMSDLLNAETSSVGILPKRWKAGDSRVVFNAGTVPVLALTKSEPQGATKNLLACLQQ